MDETTTTNDHQIETDPLADEIQALADGRIEGGSRSHVLRKIDACDRPSRWRDLALAMVERDLIGEALSIGNQPVTIAPVRRKRVWPALAACLVMAACFCLGRISDRGATDSGQLVQDGPAERAGQRPDQKLSMAPSAIVERANQQLAETGYEASLFTRFLRTNLEDGREVIIPISRVMLGHRGL